MRALILVLLLSGCAGNPDFWTMTPAQQQHMDALALKWQLREQQPTIIVVPQQRSYGWSTCRSGQFTWAC